MFRGETHRTCWGNQHSKQPQQAAHITKEALLEELTVKELHQNASRAGIRGRSKMNKAALLDALAPA
ncbi:MAG: hypothetical protein RQ966_05385 [Acetobacteraceae bacterium]|nr:hypothetical protein [Acetobacteraceae bacterium]